MKLTCSTVEKKKRKISTFTREANKKHSKLSNLCDKTEKHGFFLYEICSLYHSNLKGLYYLQISQDYFKVLLQFVL